MFLEMIESGVSRDVEHPGFKAAVVAKRFPVLQHPEENVLDQILGRCPAGQHPGEIIEERTMIAIKKSSEFRNIAVSDGDHQVFVGFDHSYVKTGVKWEGYRLFRPLHNESGRWV